MNFLSGRGAEETTVYGWNTKVSAPFYGNEGNKKVGMHRIGKQEHICL